MHVLLQFATFVGLLFPFIIDSSSFFRALSVAVFVGEASSFIQVWPRNRCDISVLIFLRMLLLPQRS